MTRILVLGSTGRIGGMLRPIWEEVAPAQGIEFTFQTRIPSAQRSGDLLWDVHGPVPQDVQAAGPFDVLLVLSGVVPRAGADLSGNTAIGMASVSAAATLGIGKVLLASSSAVYGAQSDHPYGEEDRPEPANEYGHAKLEMEQLCARHARKLGVALCNLRIGNVAGADVLLNNGLDLEKGEALQIDSFADGGTPLRSYIGPETLARVLISLSATQAVLPETLNVGAPVPVQMAALAQAAGMPFDLVPAQSGQHQFITLDCSALARLHPFSGSDSDPAQMVAQWQNLREK